jgi:signal transduction histidine kinase
MFHIQLSDHGCGMTHEQIASIGAFMQFKRDVNEQQGSGLGLPIVQKIVQLYGGRFWITSIDQQETTVHVTLPLIAPVLAE